MSRRYPQPCFLTSTSRDQAPNEFTRRAIIHHPNPGRRIENGRCVPVAERSGETQVNRLAVRARHGHAHACRSDPRRRGFEHAPEFEQHVAARLRDVAGARLGGFGEPEDAGGRATKLEQRVEPA